MSLIGAHRLKLHSGVQEKIDKKIKDIFLAA